MDNLISNKDKIRLVILFTLRFPEETQKLNILCGNLESNEVGKETIQMILSIRDQFYKLNNDKFVGGIKKVFKGVKQMFNKPNNVLISLVSDLLKGKLENNLIGK